MTTPTAKDGWILHRTKSATTDDTDHHSAQEDLTANAYVDELLHVPPAAGVGRSGKAVNAMQIMVTFANAAGTILSPTAGTTRGTFDVTVLGVYSLQDMAGTPAANVVLTDSDTLTSCSGLAEYTISLPSGRYWVSLTNITAPTGGSPTQMQIWVKPHSE
jgi:hypothetical protein